MSKVSQLEYIDYFGPDQFENVRQASKENKELWRTGCVKSTFENRGQLGEYWKGIQEDMVKWGPEGPPSPPPDWHDPDEGKPLEERVLNLLRDLNLFKEERGKL